MWKQIEVGGKTYLMRYMHCDATYKVFLTDVKNVWVEELSEDALARRCKETNPLFEAPPKILVEQVLALIHKCGNAAASLTLERETVSLVLKTAMHGIPFQITFHAKKTTPEMVCDVITFPLVKLARKLQQQMIELASMLKAKDQEIQQYKLEGATLKKQKLETEPFTQEMLHRLQEIPVDELSIPENLNQPARLFNQWLCTNLRDSDDNTTVKTELNSQEEQVLEQGTSLTPMPNMSLCVPDPEVAPTTAHPKVAADPPLSKNKRKKVKIAV